MNDGIVRYIESMADKYAILYKDSKEMRVFSSNCENIKTIINSYKSHVNEIDSMMNRFGFSSFMFLDSDDVTLSNIRSDDIMAIGNLLCGHQCIYTFKEYGYFTLMISNGSKFAIIKHNGTSKLYNELTRILTALYGDGKDFSKSLSEYMYFITDMNIPTKTLIVEKMVNGDEYGCINIRDLLKLYEPLAEPLYGKYDVSREINLPLLIFLVTEYGWEMFKND